MGAVIWRAGRRPRPAGKMVIDTMIKGDLEQLVVHSLDRLGRDLLDILKTIELFSVHAVPILIQKEGLRTLDDDGNQNPRRGWS